MENVLGALNVRTLPPAIAKVCAVPVTLLSRISKHCDDHGAEISLYSVALDAMGKALLHELLKIQLLGYKDVCGTMAHCLLRTSVEASNEV